MEVPDAIVKRMIPIQAIQSKKYIKTSKASRRETRGRMSHGTNQLAIRLSSLTLVELPMKMNTTHKLLTLDNTEHLKSYYVSIMKHVSFQYMVTVLLGCC